MFRVSLDIIGDGPERNNLQDLININNKDIRFLGKFSHDAIINLLQNYDVSILPSENETFGLVSLEA